MKEKRIPKRITNGILKSLSAGVVPRNGLEFIAVGRRKEIESILDDLEAIKDGGASFKIFIGRYGSGKSFLIQLIRNYAMEREYVVADVDLSPERRLHGSEKGIATYRELIKNLSTKTKPNGGALTTILEKWISKVQSEVIAKYKISPNDAQFNQLVEQEIMKAISELKEMVHGFDFATVISKYWMSHKLGEDDGKESALRWLRGEYPNKTEARKALGNISIIVNDDTWYDYIKLLSTFVVEIGYSGLLVFFDEAVNLYKITHTLSRTNNYEKLLTMFNDTMQGRAEYLGIFMGGTPHFLEDRRRGLHSYEALHSRLSGSRFMKDQTDVTGPILKLERLTVEEIFVLLQKIIRIHSLNYNYESKLTDDEIQEFIKLIISRVGATKLLTPREFVREFIIVLNIMRTDPEKKFLEIIYGKDFDPKIISEIDDSEVKGTKYEEFEI